MTKKKLTLLSILLSTYLNCFSITFTSNGTGGGDWNNSSTWNQGILTPTISDDVVILNGDLVTFNSSVECNDISISGTLSGNLPSTLKIYGNTDVSSTGIISGFTYVIFFGTGGETISGTGNFGSQSYWQFQRSKTINSDVVSTKNVDTRIAGSSNIITNLGEIEFIGRLRSAFNSSSWVNGNGALTTISNSNILSSKGIFDAKSTNNTVQISLNTGNNIPSSILDGEFYNLSFVKANQTPSSSENMLVNNDLTMENTGGVDMNTFSINLKGNLTNNGGTISNGSQFTFSGTGTQSISNTTTQIFPCPVLIENSSTVSLNCQVRLDGELTNNGTLDLNSCGTLTFIDNLTNTGSYLSQNNISQFSGGNNQTVNSTNTISFHSIDVQKGSNDVSFSTGNYELTNEVTFTKGKIILGGSTSFTLISDASGTARIGEVPNSNCGITGDVTIQRFFASGTGGWTDLSCPVTNTTASDWNDELIIGGPTSNGWDGCAYGGCLVTLQRYVASSGSYNNLGSTANSLFNGTGYEVLIADNLSGTSNFSLSSPLTLNSRGSINSSSNILKTTSGTWNLIGNPYASNVNFDNINRSGQGDYYYIYNNTSGGFDYYQIGNGASPLSNVINSHQGFWVNGAGTITWEQSDKTDQSTNFVRHHNTINNEISIRISNTEKSNCKLTYSASSVAKNNRDITDVPHFSPGRADQKQIVSIYGYTNEGDKLRYFTFNNQSDFSSLIGIETTNTGEYLIDFDYGNFDNYQCIILEDIKTGEKRNLIENNQPLKIFISEEDINTTRFKITFNKDCKNTDNLNSISIKDLGKSIQINSTEEHLASQINVYNSLGQLIYTNNTFNINIGQSIENLPISEKGILLLELKTENETKIVKLYR